MAATPTESRQITRRCVVATLALLSTSATLFPFVGPPLAAAPAPAPEPTPPAAPPPAPPAPPVGAEPTGPGEAVVAALADAEKLGEAAAYARYFWVSSPAKWRDDFLVVFCVHLNLLSTEGVIRWPVMIAPDVCRIDVRDYGWDRSDKLVKVYEKAAVLDVYFHQKAKVITEGYHKEHWPGGRDQSDRHYARAVYDRKRKAGDVIDQPAIWLPQNAIDALRRLTYSETPILMAEWFFVQSARQVSLRNKQEGLGYYDFLGLKDRDDFFRLTGTDPAVADRIFAHWRAVVVRSGISQQNRQVVALGSHSRRVWGTLDTFSQQGAGVARRNLRDGEFAHNAEEWYGFLGNGLWITFLGDNKGNAAESAPDKIGPDDSNLNRSRDHRVHANLSCVRCHSADKDMLKPIPDWARKTFRQGGPLRLGDPDKRVQQELESQYLRDLDELLDDDRTLYARGIARATASAKNPKGLTAAALGKLYAEAWSRYVDEDVTAADAARELGCKEKALLDGIRKHASPANRGATDLVLASFLDGQPMPRLDWEDSYQLGMTLALGLNPPEQVEKVKPKDPLIEPKKTGKKD